MDVGYHAVQSGIAHIAIGSVAALVVGNPNCLTALALCIDEGLDHFYSLCIP